MTKGETSMPSNVIAIIWDFDKTLIKEYMQRPIFEKYNVNEEEFWKEVNELPDKYVDQGVRVNRDTIYLNHILTCVRQGIFDGLNNNILKELGKNLNFYDGVPGIFTELRNTMNNARYRKHDIKLEHYIISTGLTEMIKGSIVAEHVEYIWGCEFIENVIKSDIVIKEYKNQNKDETQLAQIGYTIDNTSKTRAIFEINKGINVYPEIDVNAFMPQDVRRVPFENMIYIADGPSDVPVFSLLKSNGGHTFAVYPKEGEREFRQVDNLRADGRIDMYGEADYSKGTTTYLWLKSKVENIAERICSTQEKIIKERTSVSPKHIT